MTKAAIGGSTRSTIEDEAFIKMDDDSKELYTALECQNADMESWGNEVDVSGKDDADYEYGYQDKKISLKSGASGRTGGSREGSHKKHMHSQMLSYKQQGSYDIPEDVYAFITVAPVFSAPFIFACVVIGIKYIVYCTLLSKILGNFGAKIKDAERITTAVKFFLIPITVAMQEDLMAVYAGLANARYDPKVLDISPNATKTKFALAYLLQLIDGLLSLVVNFFVMLTTADVLDVFLQFAALHFLQDIDDVFYALVEKGFFGDGMEHMATVCKQVSWPRRAGTTKFSQFLTNLDTLLFFFTFFVCLIAYIVYTGLYVVMKK